LTFCQNPVNVLAVCGLTESKKNLLNIFNVSILAKLFCALAGCGGGGSGGSQTTTNPSPPNTGSISISSPSNGAQVTDPLTVKGLLNDNIPSSVLIKSGQSWN
jgi:hypothetical protein